jgi:diaminopimelate epimerase
MRVRFEKWEGLGNDFVVLSGLRSALDDATVRRLCDRRFGIGADGVLLVEERGPGPARMIVRNADGTRPEMCGNGLRCVAGFLGKSGAVIVATDAGEKACEVRETGEGTVDVLVDMGEARRGEDLVAVAGGREHRFLTVDMGNPHAVSFEDHGAPSDEEALDTLGPLVSRLPPGGTNVELCRLLPVTVGGDSPPPAQPVRISVLVWERGVGRTLACGTGACAVAVAACDTGRSRFGAPITVTLPGGPLEITVTAGTLAVRMRGPARRVFSGEVVVA